MKAWWSSGRRYQRSRRRQKKVQPREDTLDDPAQLSEAGAVFGVAAGGDGLDAAWPEFAAGLPAPPNRRSARLTPARQPSRRRDRQGRGPFRDTLREEQRS